MATSNKVAAALLLALFAMEAAAASMPSRRLLQSSGGMAARYSVDEIDAMDEAEPYRVLMLLAWHEMTTNPRTNSPLSYWSLAGVHGKNWAYDGTPPPSQGFCRHHSPGFSTWHRPYMRQFELGLIEAAKRAANRFSSYAMRAEFLALAEDIRLPYWDWTAPRVPDLLTAPRVTVLDEDGQPTTVRNPFDTYTYVGAAGDEHNPGRSVRRGWRWAQTMQRSSRRFGMEMASFLRSSSWKCTYMTNHKCVGNLESTHDEIHNILGGYAGEMTAFQYAPFDPLFWLHHCMIDRVLWLFQNNGGQWLGASSYSPFPRFGDDIAHISSLGYTYTAGRPIDGSSGGSSRRSRRGSSEWSSIQQVDASIFTTGGTVNSQAGTAAVQYALEQWTGNYTGYAWALRLQEFDQHQMDKAVHVYVYLNKPGVQALEAMPAKISMQEDFNELRLRPNYCGSVAGFNEHIHATDANHVNSPSIDLTECLQRAGLNPNVAPANAADPTRGPAAAPIKLSELRLVALSADGEDVSDRYNFGKPVVSWSLPITRKAGSVRAAVEMAADPVEAQAMASPTVFPATQDVFSLTQGVAEAA